MLKKIDRLKGFGVFQEFSWNNLDDFKKKNLIYGWNYSGKTTLSKLFQNLEFKDKDKYFSDSEFDITIEKNSAETKYNQNNLENFPYDIKVFNANYIEQIFTWDSPDSDIQPISFYLGDPSGKLDKNIKNLEKQEVRLKKIRDNRYQNVINEFNKYNKADGKFSKKAKEIRENYLNNKLDQNKLNKNTIQKITDNVKNDLLEHILSDTDRDKTKLEAIAENTFGKQQKDFSFLENLEDLAEKVKTILEDTAPKSISILELDDNKVLFDWVQTGVTLHKDEEKCKFCTKILPENRIDNLNSYYSKKLQEIQFAITNTQEKLETEKEKLNITFPDKKNLGGNFQTDYQTAIDNYNKTVGKYESQLTILEDDLKRKSSDYFNDISVTEIKLITFKEDFKEIEESMTSHNDWLKKFDENQKKALKKILNHYVAEYLRDEEYNKKETNKDKATTIIEKIDSCLTTNSTDRSVLNRKLRSSVKGQNELNDTLKVLLHRKDIRIEIQNNKFTLKRSECPANNLSEGEKSAIAFAYFLTELKALRSHEPPKLLNTIVFIDDPVSSLDSNHIFQVRLLLQDFFKKKDEDFLQLFISTHNFEFFSVMLDTNLFGTINKNTKENKRPLYFIKRNNNTALIEKLPSSFSSYKSEYVGLFHIIKEYNDLEHKGDFSNLLILPNAVRRFLELYTLMKYPSNTAVDARVKSVFNLEDKPLYNTKLLHWFSHLNQFEKVRQHDDKLLQIEGAIKELMKHIKEKDELHWKGLNGE